MSTGAPSIALATIRPAFAGPERRPRIPVTVRGDALRLALVTGRRAVIIWSDDRSGMKIATVAERPELLGPAWDRTRDTLPEYNNHGDVLNEYWPRLTEDRPDFQFHLTGDDDDEILARARSIPLRWDGTLEDLPAGIDGAIARGFDEGGANALCALVIMVPRDTQGRGVSVAAVRTMGDIGRRHGLESLIAPVRPSWKERYPLVPIERYASGAAQTAGCSTPGCASTSGSEQPS